MQYTNHYNLNLPEGSDIVNPLIQDNPNYTAIDNALYANKLRVIGNATHSKTGTSHTITRADTDIPVFKFVTTGDYDIGDTFTVDGVTVTPRIADGGTIKNKAFVINSTIECALDGTILNILNVSGNVSADDVILSDNSTVQNAIDVRPIIRYSTSILVTGDGSNIIAGSETFVTPFPHTLFGIIPSIRRNANDDSPFDSEVRIKNANLNGFTYAFRGRAGVSYYIDYVALGN